MLEEKPRKVSHVVCFPVKETDLKGKGSLLLHKVAGLVAPCDVGGGGGTSSTKLSGWLTYRHPNFGRILDHMLLAP